MQLDIHPEKKLVCIWLTKAESADTSAQEQLRPLYERFRKQKFLVAVFRSDTILSKISRKAGDVN